MKKRIFVFVFLILQIVFTSGCWNRREPGELGLVAAVGLDKDGENKVKLTVQIIKPGEIKAPVSKGGPGSPKAVWVVSSTGNTSFEAVRNFVNQTGRRLFWAHNKVIIIGEELAADGVVRYLDFFIRDPELRRRSFVLVARGKAEEILQAEHPLEKIPATAIEGSTKAGKNSSTSAVVNLKQFVDMLTSDSRDPVASRIELTPEEAPKKRGIETTEGGGKEEAVNRFKVDGAAVFKRSKLVGWLNKTETRGMLWVTGKVDKGIVDVNCPEHNGLVSIEVIRASGKIKPVIKDGEITVNVDIKTEGNLGEQACQLDLTKPEVLHRLEEAEAAVIQEEVMAALTKAQQEFGADIFGFGEEIHRTFPREWKNLQKNWDNIYPQLKVDVKVKTLLLYTGLRSTIKVRQ